MNEVPIGPQSNTLRVYHSIDEIAQSPWDSIVGETPAAQHGSLRTYESTSTLEATPHYFVLGSESRPSAVAVGYLARSAKDYQGVVRPLFAPILGHCLGPTLMLGLRPTNGPALLTDAESSDETQRSNLHGICAQIEDWADERGISIAVIGLPDQNQALVDVLRQRGFDETLGHPTTELEVTWDSWDGYLRCLKSKRKNMVRREVKTFASSGCRVRRLNAEESVPSECYDLFLQHYQRKQSDNVSYSRNLFDVLRGNLPDNALIYLAENDEELLGVAGVVHKGSTATASYLGISSDARTSNMFLYFNLAFYELVRDAPSIGIKRVQYGSTVYQGKIQRGCKVIPTRHFIRSNRTITRPVIRKALELHRQRHDRKFRELYTLTDLQERK